MNEGESRLWNYRMSEWRQAAVLFGITLLVFSPTLSGEFVYDARLQIVTDPFLHDPANWLDVLSFRVLSRDVLDFNRPVHLASLMLDAAAWGKEPLGYHLTSVLLHAVNVVLVWAIGRKLCRESPRADGLTDAADGEPQPPLATMLAAMLPAMLFAVHPIVTEAVCEPTFREDLLVTFFSLAGLLLAIGHRPATPSDAQKGDGAPAGAALCESASCHDGWRAAACVACSVLAIGSKESGIAAPAVLAIYWLLFRRGDRGWFWPVVAGGAKAVVGGFLIARFLLETSPSMIFETRPQHPGGSLAAAMAIEPRILALYAQLILLPVNQCADYGLYSVWHLPLVVAIPIVVGLIVAAVLAVRADRRMAIALALVVVPLATVSNVVPIYRAAADRYLYFPLAGVALAVAILLDWDWLRRRPLLWQRAVYGGTAVAALLAIACVERQKVWATPLALWTDTYAKNPVAYTAASGLGEALRERGRLAEAERATREAIRLSEGKRGDPWATLALILDAQERPADAKEALRKALEADPRLADPGARVRALAMERAVADDLKALIEKTGLP